MAGPAVQEVAGLGCPSDHVALPGLSKFDHGRYRAATESSLSEARLPGRSARVPAEPARPSSPAQRERSASAPAALYLDAPEALGAREGAHLGPVPDDLGRSMQVQQVPASKVHEQQCRSWFRHQVAEGVEVPVAPEVRDGEHAPVDPNEPAGPPR